jgi:hypothetical protein
LNSLTSGKSLYRLNLADLFLDLRNANSAENVLNEVLKTMDPKTIHSVADLNPREPGQHRLLVQLEDVDWSLNKDLEAAKIAVVATQFDVKFNALKVEKKPSFVGDWKEDGESDKFMLSLAGSESGSVKGSVYEPDISDETSADAKAQTSDDATAKASDDKEDAAKKDVYGSFEGPTGILEWGSGPYYIKAVMIRIDKYLVVNAPRGGSSENVNVMTLSENR